MAELTLDLTEKQDRLLVEFAAHWHDLSTQRSVEHDAVQAAFARVYENLKMVVPPFIWCESPFQVLAVRALLSLVAATRGGDEKLKQSVFEQLSDPLWVRARQKLEEQTANTVFQYVEEKNIARPFGTSLQGQMHMALDEAMTKASRIFADELSLPTKLRLREAFREPAADTNVRARVQEVAIVRSQFGLVQLDALTGHEGLASQLLAQLDNDTQKALNEFCMEKDCESSLSLWGGPQVKKIPAEALFGTEYLHSNRVPELAGVGYVLRNLDVEVPAETSELILDRLLIKENVFHYDCMETLCIACMLPIQVSQNERHQLHNAQGPAIQFSDGTTVYAFNGITLPAAVIEAIDTITIEQIDQEANIEVRRILIQQYGLAKYLEDSGAVQIDADEFGVLYKKSLQNDEPVVVVKVTNSTPEPDGSFKFYFLRVPPYITSARAAVAWTFDMDSTDYEPAGES